MNPTASKSNPRNLAQLFEVRSDVLKDLRSLVDSWRGFNGMIQGAARFSIVVDTNIVIGDLLWLVVKRRNPEARTELMEIVDAGTAVVYVPPRLLQEVQEQIPRIAEEKGLDREKLYAEWESYRIRFSVMDPDEDDVRAYAGGVDPKDADFVALAQNISAAGIFSKDKHIGMMGGNQISIETIASLRDYSRATAIELTLKVNGLVFTFIGVSAIRALFSGCRALIESINRAPDWVKVTLLAGGIFAALHPGTREYLIRQLKVAFNEIRGMTPRVVQELSETIALMQHQQDIAKVHLDTAMKELKDFNVGGFEPGNCNSKA